MQSCFQAQRAMAVTGYRLGLLPFCLGVILSLCLERALVTGVSDTLKQGLNVTDGSTLVSADGSFTLGFFSPGVSTKRYLGIWFSVSNATVFWVANRDRPLNSTTGVLVLSNTGSLLLVDGSDQIAWSSNSTRPAPAVAQLLGSGNLVLREQISNAIIWQSFDYLSDTLLPGMKMGKNLWTGTEWYLSSWRSADDPSPAYRHATAVNALPDNVVWDADNVLVWRTGPWNGVRFSGITEAGTYKNMFTFHVTINSGEVTFGYTANPGAPLSRVVVTDAGVVRRLVWEPNRREWETFFQLPRDVCDEYAKCGPFGLCNANSPSTMFCGCVHGFSPASPAEWKLRETSGGCRRNVALDCGRVNGSTTDGFLVLQGIKLPVTFNASVDTGITVEECGARCLVNCSCVAYAPADIGGGREGTGCIIWIGNLTDLRYVDGGQDLYVRLAKSELVIPAKGPHHPFHVAVVAAPVVGFLVVVILVISAIVVIRRRPEGPIVSDDNNPADSRHASASVVPVSTVSASTVTKVDLLTIKEATGEFSESKMIGQGGFGDVYEGQLPNGRRVAVKRLKQSRLTKKAKQDFAREVEVMSNLRNPYLVEFLYHCQEGNEWILVYEYMQNKSLNVYIFGDPELRASLNWAQRLEIIHGIAIGVAYLHDVKVIHRDLKPSNILLDDDWKPKIADFGTAKWFIEDQSTPTFCLSAGYTAHEYASQGNLTLKCDVYSFGVVLLEVISGKKNSDVSSFFHHAWESWKQHDIVEDLLDSAVSKPEPEELVLALDRCVQIGLLCVQQYPDDRPTMAQVVDMLNSCISQIAMPKKPMVNGGGTRPTFSHVLRGHPDTESASGDRPGPSHS